jgi:hypothetical protein
MKNAQCVVIIISYGIPLVYSIGVGLPTVTFCVFTIQRRAIFTSVSRNTCDTTDSIKQRQYQEADQSLKKLSYWTRRLIIVLTRTRQWPLSWPKLIKSHSHIPHETSGCYGGEHLYVDIANCDAVSEEHNASILGVIFGDIINQF